MATKFKIGDKVVGNAKASKEYSITKTGWKGTVLDVSGNRIRVTGGHWVDPRCFDKVAPKPKTKTYSVDEAFILEGYKAAGSTMKGKLKKKFPDLFKPKEIEFKEYFKTSATQDDSNEAFYIGRGHAPVGLVNKCLILQEGVSVKVQKNGGRTVLVFSKEI